MNFHQHKTPMTWETLIVRTDPEVKRLLDNLSDETGDSLNKIVNGYIMEGLSKESIVPDEEVLN